MQGRLEVRSEPRAPPLQDPVDWTTVEVASTTSSSTPSGSLFVRPRPGGSFQSFPHYIFLLNNVLVDAPAGSRPLTVLIPLATALLSSLLSRAPTMTPSYSLLFLLSFALVQASPYVVSPGELALLKRQAFSGPQTIQTTTTLVTYVVLPFLRLITYEPLPRILLAQMDPFLKCAT